MQAPPNMDHTMMCTIIQYTFVAHDTTIRPTIYRIKMLEIADIQMLKESVAKKHNVDWTELFVCDIRESKIHHELRQHDFIKDINRKSDDIFIYHSKRPDVDDCKAKNPKNGDFQTFVVVNQMRVIQKQRLEDKPIGYPLLVTFHLKIHVTYKQVRRKLRQLIQPLLRDENVKISDEGLPFELWAAWGFNTFARILDKDHAFDLNGRNLKFLVHWKDTKQYKSELYELENRPLDHSAPALLSSTELINQIAEYKQTIVSQKEQFAADIRELQKKLDLFEGKPQQLHMLNLERLNDLETTLQSSLQRLQKARYRLLDIERLCGVCKDKRKNVAFVDGCQHIVVCESCEQKLAVKRCPICQVSYSKIKVLHI